MNMVRGQDAFGGEASVVMATRLLSTIASTKKAQGEVVVATMMRVCYAVEFIFPNVVFLKSLFSCLCSKNHLTNYNCHL